MYRIDENTVDKFDKFFVFFNRIAEMCFFVPRFISFHCHENRNCTENLRAFPQRQSVFDYSIDLHDN